MINTYVFLISSGPSRTARPQRSFGTHWRRGKCPDVPVVLCYRTYLHPWGRRIALTAGWSWNNKPALQVTPNKAGVLCSPWFSISLPLMVCAASLLYISTRPDIPCFCWGDVMNAPLTYIITKLMLVLMFTHLLVSFFFFFFSLLILCVCNYAQIDYELWVWVLFTLLWKIKQH